MAHEVAMTGYAAATRSYEEGRPGYPADLVDQLLGILEIDHRSRVLDLGAGTGKLTRQVVDHVAWLGAVEPVAEMREELRRQVPQAAVVGGVAEALPLATASVDAVLCAQTFHWLDGARALTELARVLRPGGGLGLIWNTKDESVAWVAEVEALIDRIHGPTSTPRYKTGRWRAAFGPSSGWQALETMAGSHGHPTTSDQVVARVLSSSAVGALGPTARSEVADEVRQLIEGHHLDSTFDFPYVTEIWWTRPPPGGDQD